MIEYSKEVYELKEEEMPISISYNLL